MKYPSKSTASIVGAAVLLVTVVVGLFWSFQQITQAAADRQHIYAELDSANELLSSLKDAETGYRGYLLTGDEAYLVPYLLVRGKIVIQLSKLRQANLIVPAQRHLDAMQPLVVAELAETARMIELRRQSRSAVPITLSIETGKHLMDSLRAEASAFLDIEKTALAQKVEAFQSKIRIMFGIIVGASLLAGLLAVWFAYLQHQDARHQIATRVHIETQALMVALQKTNDALESARLEAVAANNAKSDFLSSMSHELRTPLNAILGFAQLMETDTPPPSQAQIASIEQILKAGWHLLNLVNEVLDLAQIESTAVVMSLEAVALDDVLSDCRAMIAPQARQQAIRLTFSPLTPARFVVADRTRFMQCLINLLSNAIKYNRPEGDVAVDCSVTQAGRIRIAVRDTGAGLGAEQIAQLFQPFNRLGQGDAVEGSGIGLVVTKRLVELMGGTIGAQSTVGKGSMFWLEFAAAVAPQLDQAKAGDADEARAAIPHGRPLRSVLYVEDNPANLVLVEQLVARRADLRLCCAATADLGIAFARANLPDVILMDSNLPGMSGIEAIKILRADSATAHIPIIALSANAMPHDIEDATLAGCFRYITKPIKVAEFLDTLDAALRFSQVNGLARVHAG